MTEFKEKILNMNNQEQNNQEKDLKNIEKSIESESKPKRKLGRVGMLYGYKKDVNNTIEENKEHKGTPGPLSRNRRLAKQAAEYRENEARIYDEIRKTFGEDIIRLKEAVKNDDESKGIIIMTDSAHDGLKEAKDKYGFEKCYILPLNIGNEEVITAYAAKDKEGNISYFMNEKDLIHNTTTIDYHYSDHISSMTNKEGSGGFSQLDSHILQAIRYKKYNNK